MARRKNRRDPKAIQKVGEWMGTGGILLPTIPGKKVKATISEYTDYFSMSDIALQTEIDKSTMTAAEQLGFAMATAVNGIVGNITSEDIKKMKEELKNAEVIDCLKKPMTNGYVHYQITYHFVTKNGKIVDTSPKASPEQVEAMQKALDKEPYAGIEFVKYSEDEEGADETVHAGDGDDGDVNDWFDEPLG